VLTRYLLNVLDIDTALSFVSKFVRSQMSTDRVDVQLKSSVRMLEVEIHFHAMRCEPSKEKSLLFE